MSSHLKRRRGVAAGSGAILPIAALASVALVAISPAEAHEPRSLVTQRVAQVDEAEVNQSLDSMAKLFATAVSDPVVRRQIHRGVAARFDGDENVLYSTLARKSVVPSSLAAAYGVRAKVTSSTAQSAVDGLARAIPRFQVAVPAHFSDWDPATETPLVAFFPEGVDDTTLAQIKAYDSSGATHFLDAQVAPDRPVIVLGVNERTDDSGALISRPDVPVTTERQATRASGFTGSTSRGASAEAATYLVELNSIRVWNVHEPWSKGDAEFSFSSRSSPCSGTAHTATNISGLDEDGDLRRWSDGDGLDLGNTSCPVYMYFWEDDGGNYDFALKWSGVSFGVKMDDSDDLLGGHAHSASYFEGDTEQWYDGLDDLEYSME